MQIDYNQFQIVIVGAGISGLVIAERYASKGKKVLVVEKRDHIGGNCFDFFNSDGIHVSKYGAHLFHTNHKRVWEYVHRFSDWYPYEHKVVAEVNGILVPVPVNIDTVNLLFDLRIKNEEQMEAWLEAHREDVSDPKNSEEMAQSRVGKALYELIFKNYTRKQWSKDASELDPSVLARIPVRKSFDNRYFSDTFQAQPKEGFTELFKNMVAHENITVLLDTDYLKVKSKISSYEKLFYTGPVDSFFEFKFGKLPYRSIDFKFETYDKVFFQKNAVINYPNEHSFTRIVEYKHITGQKHPKTTISKEFPNSTGDPYYPILTHENRKQYKKYLAEIRKLRNIYFIGRLAEYRYINMDEAFLNALRLFDQLELH